MRGVFYCSIVIFSFLEIHCHPGRNVNGKNFLDGCYCYFYHKNYINQILENFNNYAALILKFSNKKNGFVKFKKYATENDSFHIICETGNETKAFAARNCIFASIGVFPYFE